MTRAELSDSKSTVAANLIRGIDLRRPMPGALRAVALAIFFLPTAPSGNPEDGAESARGAQRAAAESGKQLS